MVVVLGDIVQVLWFDARDDKNGSKRVRDRKMVFKNRNSRECAWEKQQTTKNLMVYMLQKQIPVFLQTQEGGSRGRTIMFGPYVVHQKELL